MASPVHRKTTGDESAGTYPAFPRSVSGAPPARYAPGATLSGKYRLDAVLGEGGMGAVWRASNLHLDLPVAIKLIRADLDRGALRARLQLEARSAAKLGHPAIVRVFDVGETEYGDPFIVMELLHGETLAEMLASGRLSAARAVQLLLPIVDALTVAHARGIVHRDLKPDNLLIAAEDQRVQPKILDFGIAKFAALREDEQRLTEAGTVVGSPIYMSPEQARGRDDVDYRTDIWSLCVVLYESITGKTPFAGSNYNALLRAIVEDEPTPVFEHAAGDAQLWEIVKKGLSKDRLDRQRSMAELGRGLATWLLSHGTTEDVCGTSLEAKWGSRVSDPLLSGRAGSADAQPSIPSFRPQLTVESPVPAPAGHSLASGVDLIRAKKRDRKRTGLALGASAALIGVLALAVSSRSKAGHDAAGPTPSGAAARAEIGPTLVQPGAGIATTQRAEPVISIAANSAPPPAQKSVSSLDATHPKPAASAHHSVPLSSPVTTTAASLAASDAAAVNHPKPNARDLLAPY
jgi:serine/threonine protein kinase